MPVCLRDSRCPLYCPFILFALGLLSAIASAAAPIQQSWIRTFASTDPLGLFLDAQGKVSAVGRAVDGCVRIAYGNDGTQLELVRYPAASEIQFIGVSLDAAGNFWMAGTAQANDPTTPPTVVIAKDSPSGDLFALKSELPLLDLSNNTKRVVAISKMHTFPVYEPEIIVNAIRELVDSDKMAARQPPNRKKTVLLVGHGDTRYQNAHPKP